jgi:hypothetical protein
MDQDRFDGLTRALGAAASRRSIGRALAGGGLGALFAAMFGVRDSDAKKKRRKKRKKQNIQQLPAGCAPNCADRSCGNDGCGGSCGECGGDQNCRGGSCCAPEPLNVTCAGRCGTWTNTCGQLVECPACAAGQQCLSNGSCAQICGPGTTCPSHCLGCSLANTEGAMYCNSDSSTTCPTQRCSSTTDCPPGKQCLLCQAEDRGSGACFSLCP